MSQDNVGIIRAMYRPGDPSRFFDLLDEEIEVDASAVALLPDHPGLIRGKDAVVDYFRHYWGTWDDYSLEPTEVFDVGSARVIVVHHEVGRGRGSGTPFERSWASVYTLREDKLIRLETCATRAQALEVVGLRE